MADILRPVYIAVMNLPFLKVSDSLSDSFTPTVSRLWDGALGLVFVVVLVLVLRQLVKNQPRHVRQLVINVCVAFGGVFVVWLIYRE